MADTGRYPRTALILDDGDSEKDELGGVEKLDDGPERAAVLSYLRKGRVLFRTTGRTNDRVDATRGRAVPLTLRTDGEWIWSDGIIYYLSAYGYAPEHELLQHIRDQHHQFTEPSDERIEAAYAALDEDSAQ
jgi:hypothetical protein